MRLLSEGRTGYRVGERVRGIVTYDGEAMVEGNILYIHPENNWMTIRVDRVYTRSKAGNKTIHFEFSVKDLAEPYNNSLWTCEVFRINDDLPADKQKAWKGAMKLASAARTNGKDSVPA